MPEELGTGDPSAGTFRHLTDLYAELGLTLAARGRVLETEGRAHVAKRRYTAAVRAFRDALREWPDERPDLRVYLAEVLEREQNTDEALREYVNAAYGSAEIAAEMLPRAQTLVADVAPAVLAPLADRVPGWVENTVDDAVRAALHRFLGAVADRRGQVTTAIEHWRRVLELHPGDLSTAERLGSALHRQGDEAGAVSLLSAVVEQADAAGDNARRSSARITLGRLLLVLGQSAEARAVLTAAAELSENPDAELDLALARAGLAVDDLDAAQEHAVRSVSASDVPAVRADADVVRAQALLAQGRPVEAAEAAAEALRAVPAHETAMIVRARALLESDGDRQQTEQVLRLYTQKRPDDLEGHQLLVRVLDPVLDRDEKRPAADLVAALRHVVRLTPPPERAKELVRLAAALLKTEDGGGPAGQALADAAEMAPAVVDDRWRQLQTQVREAELRAEAARLAAEGDHAAAAAIWRDVIVTAPYDDVAHLSLAQQLFAAGDAQAAAEAADVAGIWSSGERRARALELRGAALELIGAPDSERAEVLYEAAQAWMGEESEDLEHSQRLFEESARLNPESASTWWYLADVLLSRSYLDEPPFVDRAATERGLESWAKGSTLGTPDRGTVWVFHTRALLEERMATVAPEEQLDRLWNAVVMLERAWILADDSWQRTVALATEHRLLNNPLYALALLDQLPEDARSRPEALDERIPILANLGRFDDAERLIGERLDVSPNPWVRAIRAWITMKRAHYREAAELIVPLLDERTLDDAWVRNIYAECLIRAGDIDAGREQYRLTWDNRDEDPRAEVTGGLAWTGYQLGTLDSPPEPVKLDQAAGMFELLCHHTERSPHVQLEAIGNLGLCRLAQGRLDEGAALVERHIANVTMPRDYVELQYDLDELRRRSADWPHAAALHAVLDRLGEHVSRARETQRLATGAAEELGRLLALPALPRAARIGAQAGLARLATAGGRHARAATLHRRVLAEGGDLFPEAALALGRIGTTLVEKGDDLLLAGDVRNGLRRYNQAVSVWSSPGPADPGRLGRLQAKRFFAALADGDHDTAAEALSAAEALLVESGAEHPYADIAATAFAVTPDFGAYWATDDRLEAFLHERSPGAPAEAGLRTGLQRYVLERLDPRGAAVDERIPVETPILLEIGAGLIAEETGPTWTLFTTYIPAMREAVERDLGFTLPGVRVRPGTGAEDEYVIKLDGAIVARGRAELNTRWCAHDPRELVTLGVPDELTVEEPDPRDGSPGCWVLEDGWAAVEAAGLVLEAEPIEFVIHDLEAVVRRHAADFIDVDLTEELCRRWSGIEAAAPMVEVFASDVPGRLRLSRILRTLVRNSVPLTDPAVLLDTIQEVGLRHRSRTAMVDVIRLRIRPVIPLQAPNVIVRDVPREWEEELGATLRPGQDDPLEISPERLHQLFQALNLWSAPPGAHVVVVTRRPELRPLLTAVVDLVPVPVTVVSADEISPEASDD